MREILFRGKTESGEWVYGSLISAGSYCCILESEENVHPMDYPYRDRELGTIDGKATPVIPETVGQFTGLLDKDGKKIFEGDYVFINNSETFALITFTDPEKESQYATLSWDCRILGHPFYLHRLENNPDKYKVIGNIHD